jgi:hypothetical protein
MWNQSPINVAFFVRALAAACERRAAPLALVRVGRNRGDRQVKAVEREPLEGADVRLEVEEGLGSSIDVHQGSTKVTLPMAP